MEQLANGNGVEQFVDDHAKLQAGFAYDSHSFSTGLSRSERHVAVCGLAGVTFLSCTRLGDRHFYSFNMELPKREMHT